MIERRASHVRAQWIVCAPVGRPSQTPRRWPLREREGVVPSGALVVRVLVAERDRLYLAPTTGQEGADGGR